MPTVENLNVTLSMATANFTRGVQAAVSGLGKIGLAGIGVNEIMSKARAGVAIFWDEVKRLDEIGDISENLGIAVEELTRLQFAAEFSATSAEALTNALKFLARSNPGKTFAEAVAELEALDNEIDRATRANELFGKGWLEINALLAQGTENIEQLKNASDALGATLSEEQIERAGRLADAWKELTLSVTGFGKSVVDLVGPTVTKIFEAWAEQILEIRMMIAEWRGDLELANKIKIEQKMIGHRPPPKFKPMKEPEEEPVEAPEPKPLKMPKPEKETPARASDRAARVATVGAADRFTVEGFSAAQQGQRRLEDIGKQQLNAQKQMAAGINKINGNLENAIPVPVNF